MKDILEKIIENICGLGLLSCFPLTLSFFFLVGLYLKYLDNKLLEKLKNYIIKKNSGKETNEE